MYLLKSPGEKNDKGCSRCFDGFAIKLAAKVKDKNIELLDKSIQTLRVTKRSKSKGARARAIAVVSGRYVRLNFCLRAYIDVTLTNLGSTWSGVASQHIDF